MDYSDYKDFGEIKDVAEDQCIFHEGEEASYFYMVLHGMISITKNGSIKSVRDGGYFGEIDFLSCNLRSEEACAASNSKILAINKEKFINFISSNPFYANEIMKNISSELRLLTMAKGILSQNELKISTMINKTQNANDKIIKEKKSTSVIKQVSKSAPPVISSDIFLKGHKFYDFTAPQTHQQYLNVDNITCPVCSHKFEVRSVDYSKLKLLSIEANLRKIYNDIDTLWYSIWVCSKCCYANYYEDFLSLQVVHIKSIRKKTVLLKQSAALSYTNPVQINQVFTAFYMAIFCLKDVISNPFKIGRLWLCLSWLYNDVGDYLLYLSALEEAFKAYNEALFVSIALQDAEQEQKCCLVLCELYLLKGDKNEAIKHIQMAIKGSEGSKDLTQKAQDRLADFQLIKK